MVEDNDADAGLTLHYLRKGGIVFSVTGSKRGRRLRGALEHATPDIILSDYSLPAFDGNAPWPLPGPNARTRPSFSVTGTLGEELAIETLKKARRNMCSNSA